MGPIVLSSPWDGNPASDGKPVMLQKTKDVERAIRYKPHDLQVFTDEIASGPAGCLGRR